MRGRDWGLNETAWLWDELGRIGARPRAGESRDDRLWTPLVDIHEREDAIVLVLDLPGVKREDIDLQVDADGITVQGRRPRSDSARSLRLERPAGHFRRAFRIGVPIEPGKAQASYRDGVLEIVVPKAPIPGRTRVNVTVE